MPGVRNRNVGIPHVQKRKQPRRVLDGGLRAVGLVGGRIVNDERMTLPWQCPEHPDAQIRHEWDETTLVRKDGWPLGPTRVPTSHHNYYCAECGRELAAEKPLK